MNDKYASLRLENQGCFPLYAASKEIIRMYTPLLKDLDLTYTQYITMMVLWEEEEISVKALGEKLFLDSGTMTPVLKSLEKKGFVTRERSTEDERVLIIRLTDEGIALKEKAVDIPMKVGKCIDIEPDEAVELRRLLYKILGRQCNAIQK